MFGVVFCFRMKPMMSCCPHCGQPLPKCFVCLLYLGVTNPQLEFISWRNSYKSRHHSHQQSLQNTLPGGSGNSFGNGLGYDLSGVGEVGGAGAHREEELGTDPLSGGGDHWFVWCQHCKHGGHAGCLTRWFEDRRLCGVNGCNCRCSTSTA